MFFLKVFGVVLFFPFLALASESRPSLQDRLDQIKDISGWEELLEIDADQFYVEAVAIKNDFLERGRSLFEQAEPAVQQRIRESIAELRSLVDGAGETTFKRIYEKAIENLEAQSRAIAEGGPQSAAEFEKYLLRFLRTRKGVDVEYELRALKEAIIWAQSTLKKLEAVDLEPEELEIVTGGIVQYVKREADIDVERADYVISRVGEAFDFEGLGFAAFLNKMIDQKTAVDVSPYLDLTLLERGHPPGIHHEIEWLFPRIFVAPSLVRQEIVEQQEAGALLHFFSKNGALFLTLFFADSDSRNEWLRKPSLYEDPWRYPNNNAARHFFDPRSVWRNQVDLISDASVFKVLWDRNDPILFEYVEHKPYAWQDDWKISLDPKKNRIRLRGYAKSRSQVVGPFMTQSYTTRYFPPADAVLEFLKRLR